MKLHEIFILSIAWRLMIFYFQLHFLIWYFFVWCLQYYSKWWLPCRILNCINENPFKDCKIEFVENNTVFISFVHLHHKSILFNWFFFVFYKKHHSYHHRVCSFVRSLKSLKHSHCNKFIISYTKTSLLIRSKRLVFP